MNDPVTGTGPGVSVPEPPRYQQIIEALRQQIISGALSVGTVLPSENMLRDHFKVSRHTVREALRVLRNEGLIESRRGSGSRVISVQRPVYTYALNSVAELLQYATDARYATHNTTVVTADDQLMQKIECKQGERWLRVEGYRYAKDDPVPVCWTEVYILSEYSGVGVMIGRQAGTMCSFIEEMYGVRIETVAQSLFADEIPAEAAETLRVVPGSQCIVLRRIYRFGDDVCPLIVLNYHPPERLRLSWTLRRAS